MRVNAMDISAWLRGLGLERYEQAFRENAIDEAILPKLTAEDLRDLGVTAVVRASPGIPALVRVTIGREARPGSCS